LTSLFNAVFAHGSEIWLPIQEAHAITHSKKWCMRQASEYDGMTWKQSMVDSMDRP